MSALARAKRGYAGAVQGAGRRLDRAGLLPSAVPPREHRWRHWAFSLTAVHDVTALARLGVPWWTYTAVDDVERWLAVRAAPPRVFEWGAGSSTLWLAQRAASVHSVEHDAGFAALLAPLLSDHVDLEVVAAVPSDAPREPSAKEGHAGLDFGDYVAAIDGVDGAFDLVVVDGRARAACLRRALPRLRPGGLVVFDNSRRRRYRPAIEDAVRAGFSERRRRGLTPTLPYPDQTSVLQG